MSYNININVLIISSNIVIDCNVPIIKMLYKFLLS